MTPHWGDTLIDSNRTAIMINRSFMRIDSQKIIYARWDEKPAVYIFSSLLKRSECEGTVLSHICRSHSGNGIAENFHAKAVRF